MEKYKILVVEDSPTYQEAYTKLLSPANFVVRMCGLAAEVVSSVQEFEPDMILMDIILPDGNGIDLCGKLKQIEPTASVPVVVVTSQEDTQSLKSAYVAGAMDYIRKPFNELELLIRIENVLRLREHQLELDRLLRDSTISELGRAIAHNFNQPLTAIIGAADMIRLYQQKHECVDRELTELLDIIVQSSYKLSELVDKVERLREYKVKDYLRNIKIVDIE